VRALRQDLDAGEAEAIALAVETDAPLLIMDEQHGRARADHFEIPCVGVIGVFIEAKDSGHIQAVRPYLDALRESAGFHISDQLYHRVLRDEGEHPD
jgi:predicted nucleic acid-binding protein